MSTTTNTTAGPFSQQCCNPGDPNSAANITAHPTGKDLQIGGIDCYSVGEGNPAVIIIATDVFGHKFQNVRANADHLAASGFHVVVPDLFEGDAATVAELEAPGGFDWLRGTWWPKHTQEHTNQYLITVAQALKKDPTTRSIQAIGYCYGAVGVLALLQKNLASSGAVAHPTGFTKENVDQVNAPLLFNCAETDGMFPAELRGHWETTLKEKMVPAKFVDYPGTTHGFAVRDDGTPAGVAARQRALQETVSFLKQGAAA